MTIETLQAAPTATYTEDWKPLVDFYWSRYNLRYFNPIKELQKHTSYAIRNNCGFLVCTIDCILIETLEQFYSGQDETKGATQDAFLRFFARSSFFKEIIKDRKQAGLFAGYIRSGLLHQSKTKKASILNKKSSTPILAWIDPADPTKGFQINRDLFHQAVLIEYGQLIENLKLPENKLLRERFKSKLATLIE